MNFKRRRSRRRRLAGRRHNEPGSRVEAPRRILNSSQVVALAEKVSADDLQLVYRWLRVEAVRDAQSVLWQGVLALTAVLVDEFLFLIAGWRRKKWCCGSVVLTLRLLKLGRVSQRMILRHDRYLWIVKEGVVILVVIKIAHDGSLVFLGLVQALQLGSEIVRASITHGRRRLCLKK